MSQVTNVTVEYGRSRQPAQYESAKASISFTAILGDGEDHMEAAQKLLGDAKTAVLTELGLVKAGESGSATVRAAAAPAAAEAAKPAATGKTRAAAKAKEDPAEAAGRQISENPENRVGPDDLPGEGDAPAGGSGGDIPGEEAPKKEDPKPAAAKQPAGITHKEIHDFVGAQIKAKKLDAATVKAVTGQFKVDRINDVPLEKLGEYKGLLDAAINKLAPADELAGL